MLLKSGEKGLVFMEDLHEIERTPQVIAAEILAIKTQARKILLTSAIEVGRRLVEAKEKIPYGEWLQWLEESVGYSYRTAANLVRLYEAYGKKQENPANLQAYANLSYSQALVLLGIPESERESFLLELDIDNMSVRQLEKAVKERKEAIQKYEQAKAEEEKLKNSLIEQEQKLASLQQERDLLKKKAELLSRSQAEAEEKATRLTLRLKSMEQDTNTQALARMNKDLYAAYQRLQANKVAFIYEQIERNLKDFFREIKDLCAKDPETYEVYREKMIKLLTDGLTEKL